VMTTGIKDKAGNSIGPGTVAKVLHFVNSVYVNGHSALQGIDDTTAHSLETMRLQLQPVFAALAAAGTDFSKIGIAYTFHTQTILSQGNELAALTYSPALNVSGNEVTAITDETPAAAWAKYGVDATIVKNDGVGRVLEFDINTINALNPLTGAFMSDPTQGATEQIHVLLALPLKGTATIPACTGGLAALSAVGITGCAPLMVFRHGLGGGRADMLTVANLFNKAGMAVAAIDAAKHGDRSFCTPTTNFGQCQGDTASMTTCTTTLPSGAQGDVNPPGTCPSGFTYLPVSSTCLANPASCGWAGTEGIPAVSGNYLITSNFFRTRDTMRQDLIDESDLIRVVAFIPGTTIPTGNGLFDHMLGTGDGFVIDPGTVFFSGQSLGAINGAPDVATNPRIAKAGLNVGGGTVVDVFTNSPAFVSETDSLLASLGIEPGTSAYLQFLVVAKTVLDPADPINFVGHITANTLPNLLGTGNQAPKPVLSQAAYCDQTVPNPWNFIYANVLGATPLPPTGGAGSASAAFELFANGAPAAGLSCSPLPSSAVEHAFITDWNNTTTTTNAQNDIANFVMKGTVPPSIQQ
jgi:hypothetical protein